MFRIFATLVASMTCTAALLGWLDPSEPLPDDTHSYQDLIRQARLAVADGITIRRNHWIDVEIVAGESNSTAGTLLAARKDSMPCHFRVGPGGSVVRSSRWEGQLGVRGTRKTVRIELTAIDDRGSVSAAQRLGIRALLLAINESLAVDGPGLPVRMQAGIDATSAN